jgi:hypothetical protein
VDGERKFATVFFADVPMGLRSRAQFGDRAFLDHGDVLFRGFAERDFLVRGVRNGAEMILQCFFGGVELLSFLAYKELRTVGCPPKRFGHVQITR